MVVEVEDVVKSKDDLALGLIEDLSLALLAAGGWSLDGSMTVSDLLGLAGAETDFLSSFLAFSVDLDNDPGEDDAVDEGLRSCSARTLISFSNAFLAESIIMSMKGGDTDFPLPPLFLLFLRVV